MLEKMETQQKVNFLAVFLGIISGFLSNLVNKFLLSIVIAVVVFTFTLFLLIKFLPQKKMVWFISNFAVSFTLVWLVVWITLFNL